MRVCRFWLALSLVSVAMISRKSLRRFPASLSSRESSSISRRFLRIAALCLLAGGVAKLVEI